MENVKSFFESFKEFAWDIIGYLLPGSFLLILLMICVNQNYILVPGSRFEDFYLYIFIVVSYLLGHVIYGLGWIKEDLRGKGSYTKKIELDIKNRKAFEWSKNLVAKALEEKGVKDDLDKASVREIRNVVMSFIPEHDQKIYTFMFRSEVANQTGNISFIIGALGSFFSIFHNFPYPLFITDRSHVLLYMSLIGAYFLLRKTRNRFYAIAIGLPFSIYTANQIK